MCNSIDVEFNVGPPYWMRDWPVLRQESSECKERKRKQKISPPKKFYFAEQLIKRKVLPNSHVRVAALSKWSVALFLKLCRLPLLCTRVINISKKLILLLVNYNMVFVANININIIRK